MKKQIYEAKLDSTLQDSYIDVDETRERVLSDGRTIAYRYIHGGFTEKGVKFIFCFPPKESYKNRFFQYLSPFPGPEEELASLDKTGEDDKIAFCLENGAYFVESNMGSKQTFGGSSEPQLVFKASAAVAEYSRKVAMDIYGCDRPFGYVYGGSGGGYKTMACIENTNAWDGAVPYVIGSPVSLPNTITMHAQGQRCLRNVFGKIVDALEPGGSGDMYDGLTVDEAFMLKELTSMGFPPRAWYVEATGLINDGALPVLTPGVKQADPEYFTEFWEAPGYLGADPMSSAVRDRLQFKGVVKSIHLPGETVLGEDGSNGVDDAWKKMLTNGKDAWIELEELPVGEDLYLGGVLLQPETGDAVGARMLMGQMIRNKEGKGGILTIGMCFGMSDLAGVMDKIVPGDVISMDNSDYIAIQSYYRHQVPADLSFHAWDQFRDEEGKPALPQRNNVMGYAFSGTGTVQDGDIQGKTIVIQALMDDSTCPWCGDWYRKKVLEAKGDENDFRIYYMDRCMHGDIQMLETNSITNYIGALKQALLDLSDWVERGIEPLPTTVYDVVDNQIITAKDAVQRKGIQQVLHFKANDSDCAKVKTGEKVAFRLTVEIPEGAGEVVSVDYDFVDNKIFLDPNIFTTKGTFERTIQAGIHGAVAEISHTYEEPGTYFASARVKIQRQGDDKNYFTHIRNLARVRVVVE